MTDTRIAKNPDLHFLQLTPDQDFDYPYILDKNGKFDWEANLYLVDYSGSNLTYGIRPQPSTIVAHSRSISILLSFIEDKSSLTLFSFKDEHFYEFVKYLESRKIDNGTIKIHCRKAIDYFLYLQEKYTDLNLITDKSSSDKKYQIHVTKKSFNAGGKIKEYYDHKSFDGLIKVTEEIDYIRDDEFIDWLDAINHTKIHPTPSKIIKLRWESISYLLDATGSRISELVKFTRSMFKSAYSPLADADGEVDISSIPVNKGKNKGGFRTIPISNGVIQLVMSYIDTIEAEWPDMHHDQLFVNAENGKPLTGGYLKNYSLSVIKNSKYSVRLKHVNNHSFRHRFITLNIARKIKEYASNSPFTNLLSVAMNAVRKLTLHASASSMSTYVHLAQDYNNRYRLKNEHAQISTLVKTELKKLKRIQKQFESGNISEKNAFESMMKVVSSI